MKKFALIIFAFSFAISVLSQNIQVHEQFVFERFLLNPAFTGLREGTSLRLTHRQQWTGIADGPKTSFLSFNSRLGNQPIGIGGYLSNDLNGPEQKIGFQLSFAYHLILTAKRYNQTVLSMAMSFNGQYHILDETGFNRDIYDPIITYTKHSSFVPDFNAGILLARNKYLFGVSVDHMIPSFDKLYNREIEAIVPMFTHFHGAYVFDLAHGIELKTFANVRTDFKAHNQLEVMVRASYAYGRKIQSAYMRNPNEFYIGFCYRHTIDYLNISPLSLQPTFGIKIGAFTFAYLYDMGLTSIQLYNYGSHQISIGLFLVGDKTFNVGRNRVPIINTDF